MARIRTIKPEFPQSETIGRLSRDARLLFIQLWTVADDQGRSRAASRMLASVLYPYDEDAQGLINGWLCELEKHLCIRRYVVEDTTYLEIMNWSKHQKIDKPSPSRLPEFREGSVKPLECSRGLHEASATDLVPSTYDLVPSIEKDLCPKTASPPSDPISSISEPEKPARNAKRRQPYPDDFEEFWTAYPTDPGMSKLEAAVQWEKLSPDDRSKATEAIPAFKRWVDQQAGDYRIVHAVRYLKNRRFDGFAASKALKAPNGSADRRILTPLSSEDAVRLQYHGVAMWNAASRHLEWTEKGLSAGRKMSWPPAPADYQPPVTI